MAETSGFFEAELNEETNEWDREYFASQFAAYFRLFFGNGVFGSPTNQLQVIAGEGLKLVVRAGWAFIEGYWYYNDSDLELVVSPNTSAFDRIDSVICRLNVAERRIRVIIAENTTELIRDGSYYDLKLATVTIGVAATSLSDANIVDTRMDESVCGIVTSVMKIQPTADLFAQFTDMFNTWFEGIKEQLSTDAAGNLQNQIGLLDELHTEDKTSLVNAINELLVRDVDVLDTYEEIMANTTPGKSAGGLGVKEGFTQLNNSLNSLDKYLWSGSFSSGSITIDGLENYRLISVILEGGVPCIGTKSYGHGAIVQYGGYGINHYAYRFETSGNTLTINDVNKGGTDGTKNMPVVQIYGII